MRRPRTRVRSSAPDGASGEHRTVKIERLTELQIRAMSEVADEWLFHGLATGPADRDEAEAAVAAAYRVAGLEPPKTFVWLDSPLAGVVGAWVVVDARDEVRDQVGADLWVSGAGALARV